MIEIRKPQPLDCSLANPPELIQVWTVHGDGGERSNGPIIGYCSTYLKAQEMAEGQGFYGCPGAISDTPAIKVGDKVWILTQYDPVDLDQNKAKKDLEFQRQLLTSMPEASLQKLMGSLTYEQKKMLGLA